PERGESWIRALATLGRDDSNRISLAGEAVHRLGELDVEVGEAAGIVGRQRHLDGLVDIEPFGMVVELFGDQRGARHEAEGFVEVPEYEFLGDGVAALELAPAGKLGERTGADFAGQFLRHGVISWAG